MILTIIRKKKTNLFHEVLSNLNMLHVFVSTATRVGTSVLRFELLVESQAAVCFCAAVDKCQVCLHWLCAQCSIKKEAEMKKSTWTARAEGFTARDSHVEWSTCAHLQHTSWLANTTKKLKAHITSNREGVWFPCSCWLLYKRLRSLLQVREIKTVLWNMWVWQMMPTYLGWQGKKL